MNNLVNYYMDDIIITSKDQDDEIERHQGLRIRHHNEKVLEFVIKNLQVQPLQKNTKTSRRFPEPSSPKQLQSILGGSDCFRKFILHYAQMAKSLMHRETSSGD